MAWTLVFTLHYLVTSWLKGIVIVPYRLSSPQKLGPSIPIKKTKINPLNLHLVPPLTENRKSCQRVIWQRPLSSLSPSRRGPRAFFFPSPQPPYDTERPLRSWGRAVSSYVCPGECYRWCIGAIRVLNKQVKVKTLDIQNMHTKCSDSNRRLHVTSMKTNERLLSYSR